jgi:NADPH2:quinone reductase
MDCAGGELLGQCLAEMAVGGRWILIATLGGVNTNVSLRPLLKKGVTLKGSTLRSRSNGMKALILSQLVEKVYPLIAQGTIRPRIHAVLPMTEAEKAHEILQKQTNMGKVVLTLP